MRRSLLLATLLLPALPGCMTMDGFFFVPYPVDAYELASDVIPAACVEEAHFDTEDGETLYGVWAHQPSDSQTGDPGACGYNAAAPLLVHFHGNTGNLDTEMGRIEALWSLGFDAFLVDYRGYGRSTGTPTFDGVIADGAATLAYVSEATGVPRSALPVYGHSLGGFVGLQNAAAAPVAALFTESLFSSAEKLTNDASGQDLPAGWFFASDWDNRTAAAALDGVPYLIFHGVADDYIQIEHADVLYDAATPPKAMIQVEGGAHSEMPFEQPEIWGSATACWLQWGAGEEPPACVDNLPGERVLE